MQCLELAAAPARKMEVYRFSAVNGAMPAELAHHAKAIRAVVDWVKDYLCNPHPDLGRPGAVCPFVPPAIEKDTLCLAVYDGPLDDMELLKDTIRRLRDHFFDQMEPVSGDNTIYKALMLIFPTPEAERAPQIIDKLQSHLIAEFAAEGRMIGEFHAGPPKKVGLWNPNFQPLFCPVSMLAMRHMVSIDLNFLKIRKDTTMSYLKNFQNKIPLKLTELVMQMGEKYDLDYQEFLWKDKAH